MLETKKTDRRTADLSGLVFWIVVTFGVAALASQFEPGAWYAELAKPAWTPPGWVFGPVWGILYLAMSIAAWLIWRMRTEAVIYLPLGLYLGQLLLNGLWSWLFFGRQLIGMALIDLLLLVVILAITIWSFCRVAKAPALLLIPYLLWGCFAAALNFQIWRLN